ncbi:methyltransferase [Massilia sp. WF1]|uniref:methyltransferase domain-containing protein n=1 Tax=unclassified Massilia TaxID=2609279 RepID=UPI00068997AE|nr:MULTISPECIES: methyltransferase domain-containing protein [unclassified Massilia]ALK97906.1 methyltransferase [Massilia sp. WG5]KNZ67672.1 methyltransferase [Massilia sp. WF1]
MAAVDKNINQHNAGWSFEHISEDFDSHIQRSIPLYESGHRLVCHYSDFFLKADSVVHDIGCSTGQMLARLAQHHLHKKELKLVGIDNVHDMVEKARSATAFDQRISFVHANVLDLELEQSDMIISNYTIQFMPPRARQELIDKIYRALNWGGAFFMFEKVRAPDGRFQDYANQVYIEYKLDKGFNEAEIINKSRSIKGVMEPFSTQGNIDMLRRAGFADIMTVQKYVCFEGFLAVK